MAKQQQLGTTTQDKVTKDIKDRMLNVKMPATDYEDLQKIASQIGIPLAGMIRMVINARLDKVRTSKQPRDFIE